MADLVKQGKVRYLDPKVKRQPKLFVSGHAIHPIAAVQHE